jgi:uncharacterized protein with HEPN domain
LDEAGFAALALTDHRTYRALKDALSEIGEAVQLLPLDLLARHPGVDWHGWAGLRDMVSHQYFGLETLRLRPVVVNEMPDLQLQVRTELARASPDS